MTQKEAAKARVIRYFAGTIIMLAGMLLTALMLKMPIAIEMLGQLGISSNAVIAVWFVAVVVAGLLLMFAILDLIDAFFG